MKINPISNTSFKSYVPVRIYARDQYHDKYRYVENKPNQNAPEAEGAKKKKTIKNNFKCCGEQIVRHLNGTIKKPLEGFIEFYKSIDKDYASLPYARGFYTGGSRMYLVTGRDVDALDLNGRQIGRVRAESKALIGHGDSYYTRCAARDYFKESGRYLKDSSSILKDEQNRPLVLKAYFDAKREYEGGPVKKFTFIGGNFVVDEN